MSDAGLCCSQQDCDDAEVANRDQEDDFLLEDDLSSVEDASENMSHSTEDVASQNSDCFHYVTWSVHIALAVPRGEEADVPVAPEKAKTQNRDSSTVPPKAHKAQSCYHVECKMLSGDTIKVDVVHFGPIAKVYTEDEFKILRTWHEENQTWICWSLNFNIRVSRNMLIGLLHQKIELQIWNTKDKLCSQARYDRLKAFRMPQDQCEDAAPTFGDVKTILNKLRSLCERKPSKSNKSKKETLLNGSVETEDSLNQQRTPGFPNQTTAACDLEDIKKDGTASAEISPVCLLAGETSVAERFTVNSSGVFEILCSVSLDRPLMSDQLRAELNPLVITLVSATSMPSSPVPFHILQEKCLPVYCQYKFPNLSVHRTRYHMQAANIYFRDVNVILTGLMSRRELRELLCGPSLQIEVHDRDRRVENMFCAEPDVGEHAKQEKTPFNYHGIASLNLSELLLGKKSIQMHLPIKCVPPPLRLDRGGPRSGESTDRAAGAELPPGHYIDVNSHLKVTVELACPLSITNDSGGKSSGGPFGRIIYLFDYSNVRVMTQLRSEILSINASAFHLSACSLENIQHALSNYTLNFKYGESESLDFVTGFHVLDRKTQIFVLEGLKQKAVRRLWEAVRMNLSASEEEQVIVLYNSNLGFFRRLYDSLSLGLSSVHLHEPLENIMRHPLIYIRSLVPQPCFQALSRLSQLCHIRQLGEAVHQDLFPSADMILSMSEECGTCGEQLEQEAEPSAAVAIPSLRVRMKRHAPLDMRNQDFCKRKHDSQQKDFIQENIKKVHEDSERLQKPRAAVLEMPQEEEAGPAHNYSIQTFNSSARARELLQREMAKVPGRRFTYSQQYLGATVEPGQVTPQTDSSTAAASKFWIWSTSSDQPKFHPGRPDESRVEELRMPWRENILHGNTLKPVLSRDRWPWSQRSEDFQLYSKPPRFFSTPVTLHLAGERLQQEQLEAATAQYSRWLKKLIPHSGTNSPHGPNLEFKCHMVGKSDRHQDILKDEPRKYSLRKPGLMLKPVPQLSVMNLAFEEAEEKPEALAPGSCLTCTLYRRSAIPRHASLYNQYHYTGFNKEHSFLYKRAALPLTDEEKSIFTFQNPTTSMKTSASTVQDDGGTAGATAHEATQACTH